MSAANKRAALAKHLNTDKSEIDGEDDSFTVGREEYFVLTDKEADKATKSHILDSVWAFRAEFLESHSKVADAETFKLLQQKYEDSNAAITRLIDDIDHFIDDAIAADGRGHFLATYDGHEHEVEMGKTRFYIYRTN